jgi:antitoxin component HigA of HigAB toxin-antitoxin module
MRLLDLNNLELLAKQLESHTPKGLCENICELIFSAYEFDSYGSIFNAAPDEVVPHLNVLASVVKDWVLAQLDCRHVVYQQIGNERR